MAKLNTTSGESTPDTSPPFPSTPPTENKPEDLSHFLDSVDTNDIILPRNTLLTEQQSKDAVEAFATQQKITYNQALVVISILLQTGGTAKGCDGNLSISIFNQLIKLAYLRKALTSAKCKSGERKLARFLANDIVKVATKFKIPGNLSKRIMRNHPTRVFTLEETVWLSDFQVDNESCPEILRQFISETFTQNKNISKNNRNKTSEKKKS